MTSHQLAIAKAAFAAGLLRPDPISIPREEITHFLTLLHTATTQCSSTNIQNCKRWVMRNILPSTARSASFGKYLATLSASFVDQAKSAEPGKSNTSTRRQRLHLLYLLNDILHHGSIINTDASTPSKLQPSLIALFKSAAEFHNCPKHLRKISDLLELWDGKQYYAKDYIEKLRETVKQAADGHFGVEASKLDNLTEASSFVKIATSNAPFIMPAGHGDPSTPWYDLPAGNLMPHIVPNSTRPINPELIRPLQFVAGPADRSMADAVRALLEDVDILFGNDQTYEEEPNKNIDELGQSVEIDGESYYGWSRIFCGKMRQRQRPRASSSVGDRGRGYSSDKTSSRDSSRTRSDNSSGSRDREKKPTGSSHGRRRSSLSRSPTRDHSRGRNSRHSQSYSRSMTRSRSRSPRPERYQQADKRSRSPFQPPFRAAAPNPSSSFDGGPFHPLHFIPPPGFHFDGNGLPIPPPPPPQHQGQWPPPPPPTMVPLEHVFSNQSQHHMSGQSNQPWTHSQYTTRQQWQTGAVPPSQQPQPSQIQQYAGNERGGYGWNGVPSYNPQQHSARGRGGYNGHRGGRGGYGGRGW